jgi:nucleotide-binding universal stress UspA family protein
VHREKKMTGNTGRAGGRIVVGVDGTAASLTAVRWAVQEAQSRRASVHLVVVRDEYRSASYAGSPEISPADGDGTDGGALLAAAELAAGQVLPPGCLSSERADGSPAKVLIDRSAGADLLVLGRAYPAGQSASEVPPPMGSVARACLHGVVCPVVVMPVADGACMPARNGGVPVPRPAIR